jgi:two-component system sensor kinase FixL
MARMDMNDMTLSLQMSGPSSGLKAVMNTLVDGAIVIDFAGAIQLINPAGEAIFGYSAADLMGLNVKVLMPDPYHSEHDDYIGDYIKTGKKKIIGIGREVKGQRKNGDVFPMSLAVGEMGQNGPRLFIGIIRDLTDRHRREAEFDALQARHFHLSRVAAMNEMGAAIAHEINQPLAATANYIETAKILSGRIEDSENKLVPVLDRALDQNNRAAEIISRMRTFIERGDVNLETVDLEQALDDSLLLSLSKFRDTGIDVVRTLDTSVARVRGDTVQIQQVLVNLIRNGCEAMVDSEQKQLSITIAADGEHNDMVRISVSDTGIGLSPDILPDLFTAFTSTKSGGLGVGLSISRSIVRAHGGRIWAAENDIAGATFSFTLPQCPPDKAFPE